MEHTGKRALVLAGGGAKGSYQIGVWRALQELDWTPDIITGASVGTPKRTPAKAENAQSFLQFDLRQELYMAYNTKCTHDNACNNLEIVTPTPFSLITFPTSSSRTAVPYRSTFRIVSMEA